MDPQWRRRLFCAAQAETICSLGAAVRAASGEPTRGVSLLDMTVRELIELLATNNIRFVYSPILSLDTPPEGGKLQC